MRPRWAPFRPGDDRAGMPLGQHPRGMPVISPSWHLDPVVLQEADDLILELLGHLLRGQLVEEQPLHHWNALLIEDRLHPDCPDRVVPIAILEPFEIATVDRIVRELGVLPERLRRGEHPIGPGIDLLALVTAEEADPLPGLLNDSPLPGCAEDPGQPGEAAALWIASRTLR